MNPSPEPRLFITYLYIIMYVMNSLCTENVIESYVRYLGPDNLVNAWIFQIIYILFSYNI